MSLEPMLQSISQMLALSTDETERLFPPTELFSEGWMLRLALGEAAGGLDLFPFRFSTGARWYSEARLESPFMRKRGDGKLVQPEGFTNADGVVGHFEMRGDTTAGLKLCEGAKQFVVIEAKMGSGLSKGTKHSPEYDQAARNVACMAQVLEQAGIAPDTLGSLGFYVMAPARTITNKQILELTTKESVRSKIERRIVDFGGSQERVERLRRWKDEWLSPMLEKMEIEAVPWEHVLEKWGKSDARSAESAKEFYRACLQYNLVQT